MRYFPLTTITALLGLLVCVPATAVNVTTSFGMGADATIANDEIAIDPDTGEPNPTNQFYADDALGEFNDVSTRMFQDDLFLTIIRHRVMMFRFDLTGVEGDFSDAHFEWHSVDQGRTLEFYALNDTATTGVEDWDETTVTYNTAPGFQAIDPLPTNYVALDSSAITPIGDWSVPGPNSGDGFPVNFTVVSRPTPGTGAEPGKVYDDAILPEFSTSLQAAIENDTNGMLTVFAVLSGATDTEFQGNNGNVGFISKEGLAADMVAETPVGYYFEPSLVLPNATEIEVEGLDGDYNDDGFVNAADYTVWRDTLGDTGADLPADGTGISGMPDGVVDQLDYDFWSANFGASAGSATAVPEPTGLLLALGGLAVVFSRRV